MKWLNRDTWELDGALGRGRIECAETKTQSPFPVPISDQVAAELERSHQHLVAVLEQKISDLNEDLQQLSEATKGHLFVPQINISLLEESAEEKRKILEVMLSDLLLEGEKQGIANVS